MTRKISLRERKKIVNNILSFIDEIHYNVWGIGPGMATSEELLRELKERGYSVPEGLYGRFLSRILNDSDCFVKIQRHDPRTNRPSNERRTFYKRK